MYGMTLANIQQIKFHFANRKVGNNRRSEIFSGTGRGGDWSSGNDNV